MESRKECMNLQCLGQRDEVDCAPLVHSQADHQSIIKKRKAQIRNETVTRDVKTASSLQKRFHKLMKQKDEIITLILCEMHANDGSARAV